ncbi:MAG: D-cysteine desulfhydrase family protein [Balneolaceae bacterium]
MSKKYNLGFFPTPLQELPNLSKKYPGHRIFIKRDDNTGLATGGNKTRKLEYLIQDALDNKCDTVITAGAQQSNHCRQTAAACAQANLKCHLLLGGDEPAVYEGNLLLSKLLGAIVHFTGNNRKGEGLRKLEQSLSEKEAIPYIIPYGGSNLTGASGFVDAVSELKSQLAEKNLTIDFIFFASSSGGMHAGLLLGKMLHDLNSELIAINIDKDETDGKALEEIISKIIVSGKEKFSIKKSVDPEIKLIKDYDKAGYGVVTENELKAIKLLASTEGILLDPVYTARAFYGMIDHIENGLLNKKSNLLFWHTGGIPANFFHSDKFYIIT